MGNKFRRGKEKNMKFEYTDEELMNCYKTKEEAEQDLADWYYKDNRTGKLIHEEKAGMSTVAQINYNRRGYDHFFSLEKIKAKDQADYPHMEDWSIEANFYGIDITTEDGWNEYLQHGDYNFLDNVEEFGREYIDNLERPLIFRRLLNFYGKHYDLESWKIMRDTYLGETEYSYNIFLKYSEVLGFIDDEFQGIDL